MSRVAAFLLLAVLTFPLLAQSASETIEVSLTNLDVFVTDKKGNRVHGLTREDFEIRENDELQPITNFAEYKGKPRTSDVAAPGDAAALAKADSTASNADPAPPDARRVIVIFIDETPQPTQRIREVYAGLRDFVREAVRPGDAATIVGYLKQARTRQKFTDDHALLEAALTKMESKSIGLVADPRAVQRDAMASDASAIADFSARALAHPNQPALQNFDPLDLSRFEARATEHAGLMQLRQKSVALTSIMEGLSGVEGRKIMVLAVHGFNTLLGIEASASSPQSLIDSGSTLQRRTRQNVIKTANAHGFTLYPLYTPGLPWPGGGYGADVSGSVLVPGGDADVSRFGGHHLAMMNQTIPLTELANETGGLMASGPSDITKLLPRIVEDLESYYSLAYRSTAGPANASHRVTVKTKNPDYRVRTRRAIFDKSDDQQMDERVIANLFHTPEHIAIPIQLEVGRYRKVGKRWQVPIVVKVPMRSLMVQQGESHAAGSFTVFVATGSADPAIISDVQRREQPYSFELAQAQAVRDIDFTYKATIAVDHDPDAISIGVRDDVSRDFGLARADLERGVRGEAQ